MGGPRRVPFDGSRVCPSTYRPGSAPATVSTSPVWSLPRRRDRWRGFPFGVPNIVSEDLGAGELRVWMERSTGERVL